MEDTIYILVLKKNTLDVSISKELMGLGISARIVNVPSLDEAKEMLKCIKFDLFFSEQRLSEDELETVKQETKTLQHANSIFLFDLSRESNIRHAVKYGVEQIWANETIKVKKGVPSIKMNVFKNQWSFILCCN
ncbi:MAG TPA: hypothetical protein PKM63_07040 [Panacibacter sp.]|nr:hypothetical protein [Panacibacter sp.]HNP44024.1 hypothetical protein [Panacibacter sp.]